MRDRYSYAAAPRRFYDGYSRVRCTTVTGNLYPTVPRPPCNYACILLPSHDRYTNSTRPLNGRQSTVTRPLNYTTVTLPSHDSYTANARRYATVTLPFATFTRPLRDPYATVARPVRDLYTTFTRPSFDSYTTVTQLIHYRHTTITHWRGRYASVTRPLLDGYPAVIRSLLT